MEEEIEISTVYSYDELNELINSDKLINNSLTIRGNEIKKISGVRKILGNLFLWESSIEDLGELEEVDGEFGILNFYTSGKIKSLGNLCRINDNVRIRYSTIEDIGNLKYVGGDMNLRDTKISTLNGLEKVCGNLHLPSRLKGSIDIDFEIGGKVKYWKDIKREFSSSDYSENLIESNINIPHWEFSWITNSQSVNYQSEDIKSFYRYFRNSFHGNQFINLRGESNYIFTLILEIREDYFINKDLKKLINNFNSISTHYPTVKSYTNRWLIEILDSVKEYDLLLPLILSKEYHLHLSLIKYIYILDRSKNKNIDIDIILSMMNMSTLTSFGNKNIDEIKRIFHSKLNGLDTDYFLELINYTQKYDLLDSIHMNEEDYDIERKTLTYLERELRDSENDYRIKIGLPKIGEGWISETELYYKIKNDFSKYTVVHHGKPKWIGRQHLDIFIKEINVGIEYMGSQHYESIDYFGGDESLEKTKERDILKIQKCIKNKCVLFIVNEGYSYNELKIELDKIKLENKRPVEPIIINPIQ